MLKAQNRFLDKCIYTENHHIRPRCLNGSEDDYNKVRLFAREHFIAHFLLVKIYPNNDKLFFAFHMMCNFNGNINNKSYEWAKIRFSLFRNKKHKEGCMCGFCKIGEKHCRHGTHHTLEAKEKNRIAHLNKKPSEESIDKNRKANKDRKFIHKNGVIKKVKFEDLQWYLENNWLNGRPESTYEKMRNNAINKTKEQQGHKIKTCQCCICKSKRGESNKRKEKINEMEKINGIQ
jgi:hypothetical protein